MKLFGWRITRIYGPSMDPILQHGDFAIARRPSDLASLKEGRIALINHPTIGLIVKCLGAQSEQGFALFGCSLASISSEELGVVPVSAIVGLLHLRISPTGISRLPKDCTDPRGARKQQEER